MVEVGDLVSSKRAADKDHVGLVKSIQKYKWLKGDKPCIMANIVWITGKKKGEEVSLFENQLIKLEDT